MVYQPASINPNYDNPTHLENGEDVAFQLEYRSESIKPVAEFNRERELAAEAMQAAEGSVYSEERSRESATDVEVIVSMATQVGDWIEYVRHNALQKSDITPGA